MQDRHERFQSQYRRNEADPAAASRLKPGHLGALEDSGGLHLMNGEPAKAEQRLATFATACRDCEDLRDLKAATARVDAAGNRCIAQ